MSNNFNNNNDGPLAGLRGGHGIRQPDALINVGSTPLPTSIPSIPAFTTADGRYNATSSLLPGGLGAPYAYGTSARISTQTQQAHPNRVALIIAKLYLPAPESDGTIPEDPVLQHALSDGDLAFTLRMPAQMFAYGSQYCVAPYGFAAKAVPLVNLATLNYLLWGLQVGFSGPKSARWRDFFRMLAAEGVRAQDFCASAAKAGVGINNKLGRRRRRAEVEQRVWNFLRTYFCLFGVQHGGDQQGGMHETSSSTESIVTHGAVDYVSSYAIEGKLRHINNCWRDYDVHENDDLILALRYKKAPHADLQFVLSSSVRATRNERCAVREGFFYLRPEVLQFRSFSDVPYIHVARAMNYCGAYTRGFEGCCWDARMSVTPGAPLHATFEPMFVNSDRMFYRAWEHYHQHHHDDDDETADHDGRLDEDEDNDDDDDDDGPDDENENEVAAAAAAPVAAVDARAPTHGLLMVPRPSGAAADAATTTNKLLKAHASKTIFPREAEPAAVVVPPKPAKKARIASPATSSVFSSLLGSGGGA